MTIAWTSFTPFSSFIGGCLIGLAAFLLMATHGRGLICAPIIEERAKELQLEMMVGKNTDPHKTQFTVSIDLIGHGCTTGISANDRAKTIKALTNKNLKGWV